MEVWFLEWLVWRTLESF